MFSFDKSKKLTVVNFQIVLNLSILDIELSLSTPHENTWLSKVWWMTSACNINRVSLWASRSMCRKPKLQHFVGSQFEWFFVVLIVAFVLLVSFNLCIMNQKSKLTVPRPIKFFRSALNLKGKLTSRSSYTVQKQPNGIFRGFCIEKRQSSPSNWDRLFTVLTQCKLLHKFVWVWSFSKQFIFSNH